MRLTLRDHACVEALASVYRRLPDARHIANNEQIADVLVAACKTDQMTDHVRLEMVKAFEMKESENSEMNFAGHPLGTIGAQAVAEALFQ